ncbi:MAG: ECF transporter S component [Anaerolineae bacterium]|jgi:ABC-type thiamin/hydroxymethylpyrimidine transport system permease subunit
MTTEQSKSAPQYRFSTRDLLVMAGLAGLSGVASTAINALGDAVQAVLGFAGTTQWAAGLHVTLLLLAPALVGKTGAATITALLKGGVELLSGNTHGMLVVLVDIVAGLLIDLVLLAFRRRDGRPALVAAGAASAASNVFVFQLFASAPEDVVRYVWGIAGLAAVSGAILGGLLAHALLQALDRAGLAIPGAQRRRLSWPQRILLVAGAALAIGGGFGLARLYAGGPTVEVTGACAQPYAYSADSALPVVNLRLELQGMPRDVTGTPLRDVLALAEPDPDASVVIATASDGYAFFVTMDEVATNDQLLLARRGDGKQVSYEIVGATSPKAWVRNVMELRLQAQGRLLLTGRMDQPVDFAPGEWQAQMDSASLDLGEGTAKYQGVPLRAVIEAAQPESAATTVVATDRDGHATMWDLTEVQADDAIRIWVMNLPDGTRYAIGRADQPVTALDVVELTVE